MPRSFLVKKVKLDDFPSADLENSYSRSRTDFNSRIHDKGEEGDGAGGRGGGGGGVTLEMGRRGRGRLVVFPAPSPELRASRPRASRRQRSKARGGTGRRSAAFLFWNARAILSSSAPARLPGSLAAAALTRHLWMEGDPAKIRPCGDEARGRQARGGPLPGDPAGREVGAREGRGGVPAMGGISPQWRLALPAGPFVSRAASPRASARLPPTGRSPGARSWGGLPRPPCPEAPPRGPSGRCPPSGPGKPPSRFCPGQRVCSTLHNRQHLAEVCVWGEGD